MATNDERRAVAKLLRAFARGGLWSEFSDYCNCAGPGRLADLIDPGDEIAGEVCELEGIGKGEPCAPLVDRDALLRIAEDVRGYCIQRQIAPWVAGRIYDRIREACGEN